MAFENIRQVKDFIEENNIPYSKGLILVNNCGIKYEFKNQQRQFEVIEGVVKLQIDSSNMNYGVIQIIGNDFHPRMVHTNFNPHYVIYIFEPTSKSLIIKGESKGINIINGEYKVTLSLN